MPEILKISMKQLVEYFKNSEVNKILDIGTGTGDFLTTLKKVFPEVKITGVDPNSESLNAASEKYPEIVFQKMGAEKLKFPDNTFDVASISMALHHLPDIEKAFSEMQRVVKPGGWIIVSELFSDNLNPAQEVHKMFHHFRSKTHRILGVSHNETFKKSEIIEMIENSGININFHFEFNQDVNLISNSSELEERVERMKEMLESVKDYPEYKALKPQIEEFRERAAKYGFQPATRIVAVGKV